MSKKHEFDEHFDCCQISSEDTNSNLDETDAEDQLEKILAKFKDRDIHKIPLEKALTMVIGHDQNVYDWDLAREVLRDMLEEMTTEQILSVLKKHWYRITQVLRWFAINHNIDIDHFIDKSKQGKLKPDEFAEYLIKFKREAKWCADLAEINFIIANRILDRGNKTLE